MAHSLPIHRSRVAWWGLIGVLGSLFAWFVLSFVGTFILGVFIYYGIRPVFNRVRSHIPNRSLSASLTVLFVVLPVLGIISYAGVVAFREFATIIGSDVTSAILSRLFSDPTTVEAILQSPLQFLKGLENLSRFRMFLLRGLDALGAAGNAVLHLTLALALAFFLMRDGPRISTWFREDIASGDSVSMAYLQAVDADLETVYFGNVLTVLIVGLMAVFVYHGFNFIGPQGLRIPLPTLLALLTGLATFVPLVVGKIVYLPTAAYLGWRAWRTSAGIDGFVAVVGFVIVAFLVLDLLPQTFIRPYLSGQSLHSGLVLFAYVLGAALFGWYGLFLGPLLAVLVVQAVNIVVPELLRGDSLTSSTHLDIGSEPPGRTGPSSETPEEQAEDSTQSAEN